METPELRYTRSGDDSIAYQVVGGGPPEGARVELSDRGARELKAVPGTWRLYAVAG